MTLINEIVIFSVTAYSCCINCNSELQQAISESFYLNISMFASFVILALIVFALSYFSTKKPSNSNEFSFVPLTCAAVILGIGIGGFIDGIILHQILQWHEMLSNKLPPNTLIYKSVNMFWDGIFHLFTLITTIIGIYFLWKLTNRININKSGFLLSGGLLAGWGIFNLVEGIINHHILELHNVREISSDKYLWNYGFLIFSIILLIIGRQLIRKGQYKTVF
jgi:uncharacterized membrane protein